jgi:hypothetical protein
VSPSTQAKIMTLWARAGTWLPAIMMAAKEIIIKEIRVL